MAFSGYFMLQIPSVEGIASNTLPGIKGSRQNPGCSCDSHGVVLHTHSLDWRDETISGGEGEVLLWKASNVIGTGPKT